MWTNEHEDGDPLLERLIGPVVVALVVLEVVGFVLYYLLIGGAGC